MYKMTMLLGLLVAIMSVSASGVGFVGTPTAGLEKGQWNVGVNYTYMSMDLSKTKFAGVTDGAAESTKLSINDNKIQRYYAGVGYGLTDAWEAYVQLGIADVKAKVKGGEPGDTWQGLNFDNNFAWGWGTRYTFHEQDNLRWGASLQMNWLNTSWDKSRTSVDGTRTYKQTFDYSDYDLLIAVGPTVDMGGWNLYGGPFYYMVSGDIDYKSTTSGATTSVTKSSGDLEADSNIGGFVGAQCTVMEKYDITTELSFTGDGWAIGAGIAMPF